MQKQLTEKGLKVLVPRSKGVSFYRAFLLAKEKNERIISNKEADEILVDSGDWCQYRNAFPIWTGTMTAYTKKGKRFDSVVEYEQPNSKKIWIWEIPAGYRNLKNSILVAEHPDYDLVKEKNRIFVDVPNNKIIVIENFPTSVYWHKINKETAVPVETGLYLNGDDDNEVRLLHRIQKRVGPLARGYYNSYNFNYTNRRYISVGYAPSDHLGVLTVSREAASEKVEKETV